MLPIIAVLQILQFIYLFLLPQSRTDFGYISLSSHCTRLFSLPHHPPTFSCMYPLGGQGRHVWKIVRQLPMKAGWWDVPLVLRDLAVSNLPDINYGREPILLPWRFPGCQVPALTTQISNLPLPVSTCLTILHTGTSNSLPTNTSSNIPIPSIPFILHESAEVTCTQPRDPPFPIVFTCQSRGSKGEYICLLQGIEPVLLRWEGV